VYYFSIILAAVIGILRYNSSDRGLRILTILFIVTVISELLCYISLINGHYEARYSLFHLYSILQGSLLSGYFLQVTKPYHHVKYIIAIVLFWPLTGVLNIMYLQPLDALNSNMLLTESLVFITLSLLFIYKSLKVDGLTISSHFIIALIMLVFWSSTLLFWATIKILYRNHWKYTDQIMYAQAIVNIIAYLSIAVTIFYHTKKKKLESV
jgi:hypothetical protein